MDWIHCHFCHQGRVHPYFVYCLTSKDKRRNGVTPKIGMTRHPLQTLHQHNREEGYKIGPSTKATKNGAGRWQLELVIGPFFNGEGRVVRNLWRCKTRKWEHRIRRGPLLALLTNKKVYARDSEWLKRFLKSR